MLFVVFLDRLPLINRKANKTKQNKKKSRISRKSVDYFQGHFGRAIIAGIEIALKFDSCVALCEDGCCILWRNRSSPHTRSQHPSIRSRFQSITAFDSLINPILPPNKISFSPLIGYFRGGGGGNSNCRLDIALLEAPATESIDLCFYCAGQPSGGHARIVSEILSDGRRQPGARSSG